MVKHCNTIPTKRRRLWDIPKLVEIRRNRRCFTTSYGRLYNVVKYTLICQRRMDLPQTSGIDSLKVYEVPNIAEIDVTLTAYNQFPYDVVRTTSIRRRHDVYYYGVSRQNADDRYLIVDTFGAN